MLLFVSYLIVILVILIIVLVIILSLFYDLSMYLILVHFYSI